MNNPSTTNRTPSVRAILLKLAKEQDEIAARQAAAVPYWASCPPSVLGHRAAADALRARADEFLSAVAVAS